MKKFKKLSSKLTPLNIENIDTDQIIPARFLKAVNEASISVVCLLDDVAVNESSEINLSELQKDVEHLQDQITMLENYLEAYRFILEEIKV